MIAANPIIATRRGADVLVVDETFRITLDTPELDSSDGQTVVLKIVGGLRCAESAADRQLLAETFISSSNPQVTLSAVEDHLARHSSASIRKVVGGLTAKAIADDSAGALAEPLRKIIDGVAFGCGLELVPPLQVEARSPSLERQRKLDQARQRQEEVAKLQKQSIDRAGELARQVQQLRANGGKLGSVLAETAAMDQGALLKAAFLTCVDGAATLRVAAGSFLVSIDVTKTVAEPSTLSTSSLGALRSVRAATLESKDVLLLGARGGVCIVDPTQNKVAAEFPITELTSEFGFNGVALLPRRRSLIATHAQLGLVVWALDAPLEEPIETHRASDDHPGGRCVMAIDGTRAVFASGGRVHVFEDGKVSAAPGSPDEATIVSIVRYDELRFVVVREDGSLDVHDAQTLERLDRVRRGLRVTAAATIDCLGAQRLLLAGDEGPVQMVGIEDEAVTMLGSHISGWRDVAAHNGRIAAVTSDRQRVCVWNAWEPARPFTEVHIAAVVRHRVADVAVG